MEEKNERKTKRRNDIILIGALLLIALIAVVYLFFFRATGDTVRVTVDGKLYGVYSLNEEKTLEIKGADGECNLLVIKDGKARMESASCPDGICVSHHEIFREGESIVCLPNRVVITVVTHAPNDDAPDIVS